jgi:hypothetical protein
LEQKAAGGQGRERRTTPEGGFSGDIIDINNSNYIINPLGKIEYENDFYII